MNLTVVHSIPAPYRLHLFRTLAREVERRRGAFRVAFMARTQWDRPASWGADQHFGFDHTFCADVGVRIAGKQWHLNPGMLSALLRSSPDFLMVGGLWDSLTAPLVAVTRPCTTLVGWFEPNMWSRGPLSLPVAPVKRALLRRCHYIAVPGEQGRTFTARLLGPGTAPRIATLPNLVDERVFRAPRDGYATEAARAHLALSEGQRLAVWPARLIPVKGILEFLRHLDKNLLAGWAVRIIGEGFLASSIQQELVDREIDDAVRVVPYVDYALMPAIYKVADLFMLPSLRDQNPLSVVEAMHSGLPLLVSNRIGNHPEAVREAENAWTIDPSDPESIRRGIELAFRAPAEQLRAMGQRSCEIAAEFWDSKRAVSQFLDAIGFK